MTASPDPIQAQLIAARRNQILDAATRVFARKGFHAATIKDIAGEAGIAHGTIYNYFENKTALIMGIFDRFNETDQRDSSLSQLAGGDFRDTVKAYIRHRLAFVQKDDFETFRVIVTEVLINQELRALFTEKILEPTYLLAEPYFQQWVAQRALKPMDISLAVRAVAGMFLGLIIGRLLGDPMLEEKWEQLPDILTDLLLDGLGGNDQ